MKIIKTVSFFFLASIFHFKGFAQLDSAGILYSAKMQLVSEGYLSDSLSWQVHFNRFSARFLDSKGFDAASFILIEEKNKDSSILGRDSLYRNNQLYFICNYVVAFMPQTHLFYKLKGFRKNDINDFITSLIKYSITSTGATFFKLSDQEASFLLRKKLCYVEYLDINCIRKYCQYKSKSGNANSQYPCTISCFDRDLDALGKKR